MVRVEVLDSVNSNHDPKHDLEMLGASVSVTTTMVNQNKFFNISTMV